MGLIFRTAEEHAIANLGASIYRISRSIALKKDGQVSKIDVFP